MVSILQGSLAARLQSALTTAAIPYSLVVQHQVCDSDPFNPVCEWFDHACSGWLDDYSQQDRTGTLIQVNDRKCFILCSSLDIDPTTADKLVVSGDTYQIVHVARDAASTCWVIQARA
jgi:hypothetical protein